MAKEELFLDLLLGINRITAHIHTSSGKMPAKGHTRSECNGRTFGGPGIGDMGKGMDCVLWGKDLRGEE